jgi:hypothetical protein
LSLAFFLLLVVGGDGGGYFGFGDACLRNVRFRFSVRKNL